MTAIPKGSSITPADAALLDAEPIIQERCCVCGDRATNKHHHPFRSRIPKSQHHRIPLLAVCGIGNTGRCHGAFHGNNGTLTAEHLPSGWWFTPDARAAFEINVRRERNGMTPIQEHYAFPAYVVGHESSRMTDTTADELTEELWGIVAAIEERTYSEEWDVAVTLITIREALTNLYGAKRGRIAFREQYQDHGYSAATVSRYTDWAEHLAKHDGAESLGATRGYFAARAVKEGALDAEAAIAEAQTLSISDFKAAYLGAEPREPKPITCPGCGYEAMPAEFRKE